MSKYFKKKKGHDRKEETWGKNIRGYVVWQNNDDDSSSSMPIEDEEIKLCLIAEHESDTNNVSSNSSESHENYSKLLDAFKETHEEANKLALS